MKNDKQKGFALLFTLLIISVIVAIASGTALTLSKNLVLSSTARESQIAFYQADTAGECALYASRFIDLDNVSAFNCSDMTLSISVNGSGNYSLTDSNTGNDNDPCFDISINKSSTPVVIKAKGYNNCKATLNNRVERGIEINY